MRRLVLIRHAKAADARVDMERELTGGGRQDAAALGEWLTGLQLSPDRVVISPSRRTEQTWEFAAAAFDVVPVPVPVADERVYENTAESLLAVVRDTPASVQTLAVVGHNPSIAGLARLLDGGSGDGEAVAALSRGFPAGAAALFTVPMPFDELELGGAALIGFRTPDR